MEKVDVVVSVHHMTRVCLQLLICRSVLEHKLVNVNQQTTTQAGTLDNSPATRPPLLLQPKQPHRLQPLGAPTLMQLMVDIKPISKCGTQRWHNSSNKARVQVSVDEDALS